MNKEIIALLNQMIEDLDNNGMDTSYRGGKFNKILEQYADLIIKQTELYEWK